MKRNYLLTIFGLGLGVVAANAATIKVSVSNKTTDTVSLTFADKEKKEITLDAQGNGTFIVDGFVPQYVKLQYGRASRTLYLTPEQDISIAFEGKSMWKAISFTGTGAEINTYLNSGKLGAPQFNDAKHSESVYIQKTDSLYQANLKTLDESHLPASFAETEKKRLKYYSYAAFPLYPIYYNFLNKTEDFKATENYYLKLKELATIDRSLLSLSEYREFLINAVSCLGLNGVKNESMEQLLDCQLRYIESNVTETAVREFLVNTVAYNYVKSSGINKAQAAISAFDKYVKDPKKMEEFNQVCDSWRKIASGQPSPSFEGENIEGKSVTLESLKGKYVYIDVWATWCGPCRQELPHLKALEEKYKGKDIEFVSLSCDQNKVAWKKMVTSQEMQGVQLYIGPKSEFMKEYMISGIPRFILLDKEGNILSANMSRPSQPETAKKFDELLGL